jgi:hypothetical protein
MINSQGGRGGSIESQNQLPTPLASAYLNCGGLELKVNLKRLSGGSNTATNTLGKMLTLSCSASCIFACLTASGWVVPPEGYQACTCYADAR